MKIRLAMMAAVSVLLLAGALLWLMDDKVTHERNQALELQLRGSVTSLTRALQTDIKGLRRTFANSSQVSRERLDWETLQPFFLVAQLRFSAAGPEILQLATQAPGRAQDWRAEDLQKLLSRFKQSPVPQTQNASLQILNSDQQRPLMGLFWQEQGRTWLAMTGPEFLQAFLDLQKDSSTTFAILNDKGEVLAHSTAEYIGTRVGADSIYGRVLAGEESRGFSARDQGPEGASGRAHEKLSRTDLTVVAIRPTAELMAARQTNLIFGGIATLGLLLITVAGIWGIASRFEGAEVSLEPVAPAPREWPKAPAPTPAVSVAPSSKVLGSQNKDDISMRIASAVGHEIKGPLTSVLGYCQMILANSKDTQVVEPTESILRETRSIRHILDKLLAFAGEKNFEKQPARIENVLRKVFKDQQALLERKHVKLVQNLVDTSPLSLASEDLEKALRHLIDNAVEAMERMPKKEISVSLHEDSEKVTLQVRDNGEGIEAGQLEKITDPFFSTRSHQGHLGMGLPAADGIVKAHGGEMKIESVKGKGTTVTITLPRKTQSASEETVVLSQPVDSGSTSGPKNLNIPKSEPLVLLEQEASSADETSSAENESAEEESSPANLDLDQLFALPEATVESPVEVPTKREEILPTEDRTMAIPLDARVLSPQDEKVGLPRFSSPKKNDDLDSFAVTIRRPMTRPE